MKHSNSKWLEIAICLVAFVLVNLVCEHFQKPISYNAGQGWDGVYYYKTAQQFAQGVPICGDAPLCFRLGVPYLASLVSQGDLVVGFKAVNLMANALAIVLFMLWIRLFIFDWRIRSLLVLLLLTQWHGPFRFVYWYPTSSDNAMNCFLLLGLLCIYLARSRPLIGTLCLCLVVFSGVFFREATMVLAVAFLFLDNPIRFDGLTDNLTSLRIQRILQRPRLVCWLPACAGILGLLCVHLVASQTNGYSFLHTAVGYAYGKPWFVYLHAIFIAFGPILVLVLFNWRRSWALLAANQALLVFMACFSVLAYVGGSDTERFWYWTMPVAYVLVGKAIQDNGSLLKSKALCLVICLAQAVSQRLFWTLPDFPNDSPSPLPLLTVTKSNFQYFDLYSSYGRRIIELVSLAEYLLLAAIILIWLAHCSKNRMVESA